MLIMVYNLLRTVGGQAASERGLSRQSPAIAGANH